MDTPVSPAKIKADQRERELPKGWPPALTIPELAQYMQRSHAWAWRWTQQPDFPIRVIVINGARYVSRAELDAWLARGDV